MKYVICNGLPTAGKDTFCEMCISILEARGCWAETISSVALVKELATRAGWRGEKTPKNRKFLSDLKDLLTEWDDVPMKDIQRRAAAFEEKAKECGGVDEVFIFVMIREPNEIEKFVEAVGATTVFIDRDVTQTLSNHADMFVMDYQYDIYIDNNGTLDDLHDAAIAICDQLHPTGGK